MSRYRVHRCADAAVLGELEFLDDLDSDLICLKAWLSGYLPDSGTFEAQMTDGGWSIYQDTDSIHDRMVLSLEALNI